LSFALLRGRVLAVGLARRRLRLRLLRGRRRLLVGDVLAAHGLAVGLPGLVDLLADVLQRRRGVVEDDAVDGAGDEAQRFHVDLQDLAHGGHHRGGRALGIHVGEQAPDGTHAVLYQPVQVVLDTHPAGR
jgi:hypothetical protein